MLDSYSTLSSRLRLFLVPLVLLMGIPVHAVEPAWWTQVGADGLKVINSTVINSDPKGVANIGQAKYMAKRALEAMRLVIPDTADSIEAQLVGAGKIIPSWDPPAAGSFLAKAQFSPLLIGQLKAIADPFYTALNETDSEWVLSQLAENGTIDLENLDNFFPWTSNEEDNADKAIATIGQLKAVFSLRFETIPQEMESADIGALDPDFSISTEDLPPGIQASPPIPPACEIQFKKTEISLPKYGLEPMYPNPNNPSLRFLNQTRRYFPTFTNNIRIPDAAWKVGHYTSSTSYTYDFLSGSSAELSAVNQLSGEMLTYGSINTAW